jgi:hypothetical protein
MGESSGSGGGFLIKRLGDDRSGVPPGVNISTHEMNTGPPEQQYFVDDTDSELECILDLTQC